MRIFPKEHFEKIGNFIETKSMKLVLDNGIYFEFVPFKPEYINQDGSLVPNAPSINISEVEENVEYVLIISTVSGAWRYLIGDTIKFTNIERAEIIITGRTKFFLNVVGSQLSVNKMNDAIQEVEEKFDMEIPEFTIAATKINDIHSIPFIPKRIALPPSDPDKPLSKSATAVDAKYVCAPYQNIATIPLTIAGKFAPMTPILARANTG